MIFLGLLIDCSICIMSENGEKCQMNIFKKKRALLGFWVSGVIMKLPCLVGVTRGPITVFLPQDPAMIVASASRY